MYYTFFNCAAFSTANNTGENTGVSPHLQISLPIDGDRPWAGSARGDAPASEELWFHRDPAKWEEYRRRYWEELRGKEALVEELEAKGRRGMVTLVYRAKDTEHNNALALLQYLEQRAARRKVA